MRRAFNHFGPALSQVPRLDDDDLGQVDEVEPLVEYCRDRFAT